MLQGCFQPGRVPDQEIVCEECGLAQYCSWGCRAGDEMHQYECGAWQEAGQAPDRHGNILTAANDEASHRYLFVIFGEGDVALMLQCCTLMSKLERPSKVRLVPGRDAVRMMVRAVGKLQAAAECRTDERDLVAGGGAGDSVPGRLRPRRFADLLSHKEDFLRSKEKTEHMKVC